MFVGDCIMTSGGCECLGAHPFTTGSLEPTPSFLFAMRVAGHVTAFVLTAASQDFTLHCVLMSNIFIWSDCLYLFANVKQQFEVDIQPLLHTNNQLFLF